MALGLADELVEQLGTLDVQEVRLRFLGIVAARSRDLLGKGVGDGLGDERLTATGRPVEQHALGRTQCVIAEQILVQERQFDGVADLLDLPAETTDVLVPDVGHLFEDEILDLGLGDSLEREARLGVDQQRIAGAQLATLTVLTVDIAEQWFGEPHDPLLVGMADDQCALTVAENLAQRADLTNRIELARLDNGQRLVETQRLTLAQRVEIDVGRAGQPHLAA